MYAPTSAVYADSGSVGMLLVTASLYGLRYACTGSSGDLAALPAHRIGSRIGPVPFDC